MGTEDREAQSETQTGEGLDNERRTSERPYLNMILKYLPDYENFRLRYKRYFKMFSTILRLGHKSSKFSSLAPVALAKYCIYYLTECA